MLTLLHRVAEKRALGRDGALATWKQLKDQLTRISRRLSNLYDAIADGTIQDKEFVREKIAALEEEHRQAAHLAQRQEAIVHDTKLTFTPEEAERAIARIVGRIVSAAPAMQ